MKTMLFLYVGSSVFLAFISLPLIARKIKPNPFYGFRIQQTLDDPEVWYETNQYFAKRLCAVGILEALASVGFYFIPNITVDAYALLCLGVFVVAFTIAMIQSWRHMKSIK
jgi:hypothetical protein